MVRDRVGAESYPNSQISQEGIRIMKSRKFGRWLGMELIISTVFWFVGESISNIPQLAGRVEPVLASISQPNQPSGVEPVSGRGGFSRRTRATSCWRYCPGSELSA
jgi:hypothetical protein